ncbi:MAG: chromate transporter, partial [Candidatus Magasanikbacteria bacterium]|nr:chromate transporter [Candidatus Magasanikbacteria bacterium]
RALKNNVLRSMSAIAFVAVFAFDIPFPYVVLAAGLVGYIGGRVAPAKFKVGGHHAVEKSFGPALIDDATPTPEHALFKWSRFGLFVVAGLGLWMGAIGLLIARYGWEGTFTQMGWFFTKAALLTFGGAYAVLPYVYQGAVEQYQWLAPTQMIDGLALGETTPGPLIMVVAFVGFVGGWSKAVAGSLLIGGALGAAVATFFTFLPSFLFILVGGPLVETTHNDITFTSPLTGITAAIVGVIFNLAVFFSWHVLWPNGFGGDFEWVSAAISVAGLIALFRYKVGVIPLIGCCGIAGLLHTLLKTFL